MWFVVKSFDLVRMRLSLSVALDLFGEELQVIHVILLLQCRLVHGYHILLLLLPVELLALELSRVLDLLALFLESLMS